MVRRFLTISVLSVLLILPGYSVACEPVAKTDYGLFGMISDVLMTPVYLTSEFSGKSAPNPCVGVPVRKTQMVAQAPRNSANQTPLPPACRCCPQEHRNTPQITTPAGRAFWCPVRNSWMMCVPVEQPSRPVQPVRPKATTPKVQKPADPIPEPEPKLKPTVIVPEPPKVDCPEPPKPVVPEPPKIDCPEPPKPILPPQPRVERPEPPKVDCPEPPKAVMPPPPPATPPAPVKVEPTPCPEPEPAPVVTPAAPTPPAPPEEKAAPKVKPKKKSEPTPPCGIYYYPPAGCYPRPPFCR